MLAVFLILIFRPFLLFFLQPWGQFWNGPLSSRMGVARENGPDLLNAFAYVSSIRVPFLFHSIGVKKMLLMGMTAWILRYICFAYGNAETGSWMLYTGIILHGICYDFFFVTGYMYTEKKAGEKIKNAAQGLFTFATYGVGMFIGTWFSGYIVDQNKTGPDTHNWQNIWYVPAYIALGVLVYFLLFFKEKKPVVS